MTINFGKRKAGGLTAASPGDTLYVPFAAYNDSGASIALSGLAVTDIEIFKNGGAAPRATDSGYSLISDTGQYGDRTGLYRFSVDIYNTADDTGFFDAGGQYHIAVDAVTIDGRSVRFFPGVFEVDTIDVNIASIVSDTGAAGNLRDMHNGTGYVDDTAPATQNQLAGIANVGSAVNIAPASDGDTGAAYVLTTGTQSSGTVASVEELDGTNHEHADAAGTLDLYYEFHIGGGVPSSVEVTGYVNSSNDVVNVFGFDWVSSTFKQIGSFVGKNPSTNEVNAFALTVNMVGSGADEGKVRVQFQATGLSSSTLAVDQILCQFSRGSEGYDGGAVWLDTNKSNTNTVVGVDGTARNPVGTIAAANTLLAATNLRNIYVAPGSSVTFAAAQENQVFMGHDWTLALGGQSISNSYIQGADISGIATGANAPRLVECTVAEVSLPASVLRRCRIIGATAGITLSTDAGNYVLEQCFSGIAGGSAPKMTFGTGAQTVNLRHWSGGLQLEGMISGQTVSMEGHGQLIEGTCTAGSISMRGAFTISGITNLTLSDDARFDINQVVDAVWDETDTGHSDTGTFGRLRQGVNVGKLGGDTGALGRFASFAGTKLTDSGTFDTGTGQLQGAAASVDTGAVSNAVWNSVRAGHSVTGSFGEHVPADVQLIDGDTGKATHLGQLADEYDTGRLAAEATATLDTGAVNQAVWQGDGARVLTANTNLENLDVTVTALSDTGINERLATLETAAAAGATAAALAVVDFLIDGLVTSVATVDTVVDAIQAKTDSLTFTVAGQVDANIQYVNDVAVTGVGDTGTGNTWGIA